MRQAKPTSQIICQIIEHKCVRFGIMIRWHRIEINEYGSVKMASLARVGASLQDVKVRMEIFAQIDEVARLETALVQREGTALALTRIASIAVAFCSALITGERRKRAKSALSLLRAEMATRPDSTASTDLSAAAISNNAAA